MQTRFIRHGAIALLLALLIRLLLRPRVESPAEGKAPAVSGDGAASEKAVERTSEAGRTPAAPSGTPTGAPAMRHVSGRVLHADRSGAENCGLVLVGIQGQVKVVFHAGSGREGAFQFEQVPPGRYQLSTAGHTASVDFEVDPETDVRDLELTLPSSQSILATVVDARGAALAGVRVGIAYDGRESSGATDERGTVRFTSLDPMPIVLVLEAPPGARRYLLPPWIQLDEGKREVRFVLEDAGLATGVVLTPRGFPSENRVHTVKGDAILGSTDSDKNGRFEACVPLEGTASLVIDGGNGWIEILEEGSDESIRVTGRLDGVRAGDRNLELRLAAVPKDRKFRVRVESPAGKPVSGAQVELIEDPGLSAFEVTDALGVAAFENLYEATMLVKVMRPAQDPAAADWLTAQEYRVTPAGQEIVVKMREGIRLRGVVLLPDGEPCPGATVCPTIRRADCPPVEAGEDGGFEFLIDPDDPDPLELVAWAELGGEKYLALTGRVDPRAGLVTIRLRKKP